MEKIFIALLMLGSIFATPTRSSALTPEEIFDTVKDSIVVVKTFDSQMKPLLQGSGVILSSDKIATNCHVLKGVWFCVVSQGRHSVYASRYAEDQNKDVCIMSVEGLGGRAINLGSANGLKVGNVVYAVGAPEGLELSLSTGIVSQLRGGPPPIIQTTAAISHGSSGGGLFDKDGRLVGLTSSGFVDGQNLNFAIPVEWLAIQPHHMTNEEIYGKGSKQEPVTILQPTTFEGCLNKNIQEGITHKSAILALALKCDILFPVHPFPVRQPGEVVSEEEVFGRDKLLDFALTKGKPEAYNYNPADKSGGDEGVAQRFYEAIESVHPDFPQIAAETNMSFWDWFNAQPKFFQHLKKSGDPDIVCAVISLYKSQHANSQDDHPNKKEFSAVKYSECMDQKIDILSNKEKDEYCEKQAQE